MLQCSRRLVDEALESRLYPPSALAREEARAAAESHRAAEAHARGTLEEMIGSAWAWRRAHPEGYAG